jgi:hypothetical protein
MEYLKHSEAEKILKSGLPLVDESGRRWDWYGDHYESAGDCTKHFHLPVLFPVPGELPPPGKKYDQGKIRPTLIPAGVYLAILEHDAGDHTCQDELQCVALSLIAGEHVQGLASVQDLLCPSPHPDSRLHGLDQILQVLEFGAKKYGENNWQGVARDRYIEAAWRHLIAHSNGEALDSESGLPHLTHLGCCLVFLVYFDAA